MADNLNALTTNNDEPSNVAQTWADAVNPEVESELDSRVESLAIPLAQNYAENNYARLENGTLQPAWRGINGEKQYKNKSPEEIAAEEGITLDEARARVIDIANQPYNEYSEYWKNQNRDGAKFLIELLDTYGKDTLLGLDLTDKTVRQTFGDLIHDNWLKCMGGADAVAAWNPEQAVPYARLNPSDQQKDIDHLNVLQDWLQEQANL